MRGAAGSGRLGWLAAVAVAVASCAARPPARPVGSPTVFADAVPAFDRATAACAGLRTMTMELGLSGRAGAESLRGRIIAGFERGGAVRLEGVAPFGAPLFILVARDEQATLLLPRDRRVLSSTSVAAVLERLTGLALGADDLLQALSGCVGAGEGSDGRQWAAGWLAVSAPGGRTVFLRVRQGVWVVAAVDGGGWRADYGEPLNGFPRQVRLRSVDGRVDLIAKVQQLETNTDIDDAAFEVRVPPGTAPMTLDELRSVAPLRQP